MVRAIETRNHDRVTIFGPTAPDIIYYLPVTSFRPDAESWGQLQAEYMEGRNQGEKMYDWLRRVHHVTTSVAAFKRAAGELDHIPTEFTDLLTQVEIAASRRSDLSSDR